MQIIYPRIVTRPTVGEQMTQKSEVTSTNVATDTATANVRTFAGAGDISLQLLRRSSPSFLSFYLDLLAEAYAKGTNAAGLAALLAAGVTPGGEFAADTGAIPLGAAFTASVGATGAPPDTMWISTAVVAGMIDARDSDGDRCTQLAQSRHWQLPAQLVACQDRSQVCAPCGSQLWTQAQLMCWLGRQTRSRGQRTAPTR